MLKRELKRLTVKSERFLEPFAIVALLLVFGLPILTVVNLSPAYKSQNNSNVLGVNTSRDISYEMFGGYHDVIKNENVENFQGKINYTSTIVAHNAGTYSKPVLQIENGDVKPRQIKVLAYIDGTSDSDIYLKLDNGQDYILQNKSGEVFDNEIILSSGTKVNAYLSITSENSVSFDQNVKLKFINR